MRAAALQMDAAVTDPAARRALIRQGLADAAAQGCDVLVCPELAVTGYGAGEAIAGAAETAAFALAPWQERIDRLGIALVLGLAICSEAGLLNAAALLSPGETPVVYAKRMLYGDYEKALFVPGNAPAPLVTIAGVRCGLLVCFDVEFPELCRELAMAGAQAILVPTALPRSDAARFIAERLVPVRAFENQLFVVYADHCGADSRFAYQGCSVCAAPDGSRLAAAGESEPALLVADLEPAAFATSRAQNPYLTDVAARLGGNA